MIVRWKPLLVLSGVFAVIAVVGIAAIAWTLVPRGSKDILPAARAERVAGKFEKAKIHYQRALQLDGKNPAIHEEMASMFAEWARQAPAAKKSELSAWRIASLEEAAKYGAKLYEPRRQLLAAALDLDEPAESIRWAKQLLTVEGNHADAHFALANEALDLRTPDTSEAKRELAALEKAKAAPARLLSIQARLARATGDTAGLTAALTQSRTLTLPADANVLDRTAMVRLRALDVETTEDVPTLAKRVEALQTETRALAALPEIAPNRIMRLSLLLEHVQKSLMMLAAKGDKQARSGVEKLVDSVEQDVEAIFQRSLATASKTDLQVYLVYADHLRFRGKRDECFKVVAEGLKSPLAKLPVSNEVVMGLHSVAIEAALSDEKDPERFAKASDHIKELIASTLPRYQGLGHLFQGSIELEQSGVSTVVNEAGVPVKDRPAPQPKLRVSALNHLKLAAEQLDTLVEAQARYGVALILSQELGLGRQYLQNAMRLGNAEPQFQVWAAWSMVQAGYPEEAEPVVNHLLNELANGRVSRDLEGTLHLLSGEIHQSRHTPDELKNAQADYARSYNGKKTPPAVQLRMAQIDVELNQPEQALKRIDRLRATGQGNSSAEHLAIMILLRMGKPKEAHEALAAARAKMPDSDDLVGLEAALYARDNKAKEADKVLTEYLARYPEHVSVILMRAQVLSDMMHDDDAARKLLVDAAERSDNSAPFVQLALLDLKRKDHPAVSATIAKIRARWKEAAAADLLEAQLALDQGNLAAASASFDAALKKDPANKIVQFWKAQLDTRLGAPGEAAKAFETLSVEGSSKQLETGFTIASASKAALANLSLQSGDVDDAIRRFESLRTGGGVAELAREDRWQLVKAYVAKSNWPAARKEIAGLLNDPKNPPTSNERVRAANFYRLNTEDAGASALIDFILKSDPGNSAAVMTRASMLAEAKRMKEAAKVVRDALNVKQDAKPPVILYLLLAALENDIAPTPEGAKRSLAALEEGLVAHPDSMDLVREKYKALVPISGADAAVAFVESIAKKDDTGATQRLLADIYRQRQDFTKAEQVLTELAAKSPRDPSLAAVLVRTIAIQAVTAGAHNDRDRERACNDKVEILLREDRKQFPNELIFCEEECELAVRRGDVARALVIANEAEKINKSSPVAPLLKAKLFTAQGRTADAADAYAAALRLNPGLTDVRLLHAQARLQLGETDTALLEAKAVLQADPNRAAALMLEARALSEPGSSAAHQAEAVVILTTALKAQPRLAEATHLLAEIQVRQRRRDLAVATLRQGLEAVPDDGIGISQLIQLLATPSRPGAEPDPADMKAAAELAQKIEASDKTGGLTLAVSVGYHKAEQLEAARVAVEKAAAKLDSPVVHLNYGDILLALADRVQGEASKAYVRQAVEQYDKVLSVQANSLEALNNKAWCLHNYLGESKQALEVTTSVLRRVDPTTLPGEFFDTLGAIQEAVGKPRDAEDSYSKGLRKSPRSSHVELPHGQIDCGRQDARRQGPSLP